MNVKSHAASLYLLYKLCHKNKPVRLLQNAENTLYIENNRTKTNYCPHENNIF